MFGLPRRVSAAFILVALALLPLNPAVLAQADTPAAQPAPAAPAAPPPEPSLRAAGQATHGWIVERDESRGWSTLWHFPPRTASTLSEDRLTVRAAAGFATPIERWAGHGARVYLLSTEERVGAVSAVSPAKGRTAAEASTPNLAGGHARQRRLLSVGAAPASPPAIRAGTSTPQTWIYPPGRPEVLPALSEPGDLLDMTATWHGPVVLLRRRDSPPAVLESASAEAAPRQTTPPGEQYPLRLAALCGDRWQELPLPETLDAPDHLRGTSAVLALVTLPPTVSLSTAPQREPAAEHPLETIGLVAIDPAEQAVTLWRGVLRPTITQSAAATVSTSSPRPDVWLPSLSIEWTSEHLDWPESWQNVHPPAAGARARTENNPLADRIVAVDGQLLALRHTPEPRLVITALRARESIELTTLPGIPRRYEAQAADGSGVLTLLWRPRTVEARPDRSPGSPPPASTPSSPRAGGDPQSALGWRVIELSAFTGRVLDERTTKPSGPLSLPEFQLLAGLLVFIMIAVVLFILRSEPAGAAPLPRKTVLADPGRRLVAALLDFIPSVLLAAWITGEQPASFLNPLRFLSGESGFQPLVLALGSACLHCTLGEWLSGASLGKSLARCMVISGQSSSRVRSGLTDEQGQSSKPSILRPLRIELWQAAVRNIIKWAMPPLAALCVVDSLRRHPGDLAAQTLVISPEPEPDDT